MLPALTLALPNSNFAALEDDDDADSPAGAGSALEVSGSASGIPTGGPGARLPARGAASRVDWRLGSPAGAQAESPTGPGAAAAVQKDAAAKPLAKPLAAEDAAQRALFATLGHLYASARVELIRLADALCLESQFSGEASAGDAAPGTPGGSSTRGSQTPGTPSSMNWLSPMRLPVKGASAGGTGGLPSPARASNGPHDKRQPSRLRSEGDAPQNGSVIFETASVSDSGDLASPSDGAETSMPTLHGLLLHSDLRFIERAVRFR